MNSLMTGFLGGLVGSILVVSIAMMTILSTIERALRQLEEKLESFE